MNSSRRFFSGDSLQQALVQAANHFSIEPEEVAYRLIDKRHGFVKVRRKVLIEVDAESPRRLPQVPPAAASPGATARPEEPSTAASSAAAARPEDISAGGAGGWRGAAVKPDEARERRPGGGRRDERPPRHSGLEARPARPRGHQAGERGSRSERSGAPGGERGEEWRPASMAAVRRGLVALPERPRSKAERFKRAEGPRAEAAVRGVDLLLRIAGLNLTAEVFEGEERLEVDLSGPDADWCFADDGELLMAFEHLLPRIIRSLSGESLLCRVDCDNFHEIREERLRSLAQTVADEVQQRGRSRTLLPMNPADRRIIHVTLADNPAVVTESEGDGYFKRITVRPV